MCGQWRVSVSAAATAATAAVRRVRISAHSRPSHIDVARIGRAAKLVRQPAIVFVRDPAETAHEAQRVADGLHGAFYARVGDDVVGRRRDPPTDLDLAVEFGDES